MAAVQIDGLGFYLPGEDLPFYEGEETETLILTPIPQDAAFWHPRWQGEWLGDRWSEGSFWTEGITKEEIAARTGTPQTLPEAKAFIQQQIIDLAGQKQESLVAGYSTTERDSWDLKEHEAKVLIETGDIEQAKYLSMEAIAMTGATTPDEILAATKQLGQVIIQKADQLRTASALISGTRARKWAEVEAMGNVQQVLSYPIEQGW